LEAQKQPAVLGEGDGVNQRRQPRFKIELDVSIDSRSCGILQGYTVDISESGISALLRIEVPVGELVELDFILPLGPVKILAVVRQRNAFRYGFQFTEENRIVQTTCHRLAMERSLLGEL
jgi:hypothetical protein